MVNISTKIDLNYISELWTEYSSYNRAVFNISDRGRMFVSKDIFSGYIICVTARVVYNDDDGVKIGCSKFTVDIKNGTINLAPFIGDEIEKFFVNENWAEIIVRKVRASKEWVEEMRSRPVRLNDLEWTLNNLSEGQTVNGELMLKVCSCNGDIYRIFLIMGNMELGKDVDIFVDVCDELDGKLYRLGQGDCPDRIKNLFCDLDEFIEDQKTNFFGIV